MVSSQKVADEALPWMKSTGTPLAGPLKSAWIFSRGVSIILLVMPGRVGIEAIGFSPVVLRNADFADSPLMDAETRRADQR
jgi:hypothetical protein